MIIEHSSGPWKKHKYLKKVGNRYIYKEEKKFDVVSDLNEIQKENSEKAREEYNDARAERDAATDPYKKAPKGVLKRLDWAFQRLQEGIPIDSKEYEAYWRSGKKHVRAVWKKPVIMLASNGGHF